ncbi:Zn-dependent hydrolase/oxidoreductase family protein [Aspergillus sclerotiicarbonarius CBS 121057]|uniref:Zn-dependent hydrolase/oxidoreductase family protein n=1 Tax=Aspergillus sclerotiicarbonarius (strain CBS 121057 / IBT 28362) TaxID=1448318 RepID=A0A319DYH3_ASPSB|nr:Zn-dependent hydrolase/oxidoreductase family protein [Aspergillus sclerotiicarbonarius CBS 121057]
MASTTSAGSTSAALFSLTVLLSPVSPGPEDVKEKSHHLKDGFQIPWDSWTSPTMGDAVRMWGRILTGKIKWPDVTPPTVPVQKPTFLPTRETSNLRATWLGHACYYVEFPGGLRVLFDPVFEDRCSPVSWMGPKRFTDIPCRIEDIPTIDAVVISHNHYDHLSHPTVKEIAKRHPNCHFFAPLGNKKWFTSIGINNMTELDWWDERDIVLSPSHGPATEVNEAGEGHGSSEANITARIGCLPSQHTTNRGVFDRAKTLWASWSIESGGQKLWFAGDTGYRGVPELPAGTDDHAPEYTFPSCPAFKQIGQFRGPFDLGLIPIGAYSPRWFMSSMHADPHDAVQIFQDTKCKRAMAIHWGTWVLTDEAVLEPPKKLKEALKKHSIPEVGVFDVCDIGESREF